MAQLYIKDLGCGFDPLLLRLY